MRYEAGVETKIFSGRTGLLQYRRCVLKQYSDLHTVEGNIYARMF